ncbi:MAG: hypothetical protein IJX27_07105 [Clostridia bacterium]|nr:hypothetical protein [Clostridia bacterium]
MNNNTFDGTAENNANGVGQTGSNSFGNEVKIETEEEEIFLERDFVEEAKVEFAEKTEKNHQLKIKRKLNGTMAFFIALRVIVIILAVALTAVIFGICAHYTYKLFTGTFNTFIDMIMERFDGNPYEKITAIGAYFLPVAFVGAIAGFTFVFMNDMYDSLTEAVIAKIVGGIVGIGCSALFIYAIKSYFATAEGFWAGVGRFFYAFTFILDFPVLVIVNLFLLVVAIFALGIVGAAGYGLFALQYWLGGEIECARAERKINISREFYTKAEVDYDKFYESGEYKNAEERNKAERERIMRERRERMKLLNFPLILTETKNKRVKRGKFKFRKKKK